MEGGLVKLHEAHDIQAGRLEKYKLGRSAAMDRVKARVEYRLIPIARSEGTESLKYKTEMHATVKMPVPI